jgi:hypothetical protein
MYVLNIPKGNPRKLNMLVAPPENIPATLEAAEKILPIIETHFLAFLKSADLPALIGGTESGGSPTSGKMFLKVSISLDISATSS